LREPSFGAAFHERFAKTSGNSKLRATRCNAKERGVTVQEATGRQRRTGRPWSIDSILTAQKARSTRSLAVALVGERLAHVSRGDGVSQPVDLIGFALTRSPVVVRTLPISCTMVS
jgi:hypothetical protein